jgi:hypothetical protein
MRKLIAAGLLAGGTLIGPQAGIAYEGPWCAVVTQGSEVVEELCSMQSFEMCRVEARRWGPTGFCRQNPRFPGYWVPPGEVRPRAARKYRD